MTEPGITAADLCDDDLAEQGVQLHATRQWVFLHGTAQQFRLHTQRMLELEQEYLRRFPKRTWQTSGGSDGSGAPDLAGMDTLSQVRIMTRNFAAAIERLLGQAAGEQSPPPTAVASATATTALLRRYAAAPGGRLHKLEAHQAAREAGVSPADVAALYKADPPLLVTDGQDRCLTEAGRARLG
jgi:hypothetical protein